MRTAIRLTVIVSTLTITGASISARRADAPRPAAAGAARAASGDQTTAFTQFRALPLRFEPNVGQADREARFLSRVGPDTLYLTADAAVFVVAPSDAKSSTGSVLTMSWVGANRQASIAGVDELPSRSNYFIGADPGRWHDDVPNFGKVRYNDLYRGIDLLYYGNRNTLEYDLILAPGARPDTIRMKIAGADRLSLADNGDLVVGVGGSEVRLLKPVVYQTSSGNRTERSDGRIPIEARYVVGRDGDVRFKIGAYDRARPLVIDPQVSYSTYLGGSASDIGWRVAVDSAGMAYLTGWSKSVDFPVVNPMQSTTTASTAAVVVKINPELPAASSLIYSTYLSGSSGDTVGRGIAVNAAGEAYVSGDTNASDFPTTTGAYQRSCKLSGSQCSIDVFAAKLDASGRSLLYSTYVGGVGTEYGFDITTNDAGRIFLTGPTGSSDFPTTVGAYQRVFAGGAPDFGDVFVTVLNPAGSGAADLVYSTYLGGSGSDTSWTIATDAGGSIYVAGNTTSTNFPTTASAYSRTFAGNFGTYNLGDAFVMKLRPAGTGPADLLYSTFLGGSEDDRVHGIAVDASGTMYVAGWTTSSDFPVTANAFQTTFGGGTCSGPCADAFVARIDPLSSGPASLWYSTFFGGSGFDLSHGIALDSAGFVYIAGETSSTNLRLVNPIQSTCTGGCTPSPMTDVLVAKFDLSKSGAAGLLFSTYLGGADVDTGWDVAADANGNAYVTGQVFSTNYPTVIAAQPNCNNCSPYTSPTPRGDVFLTKICTTSCPALGTSPASLSFGSRTVGSTGPAQSVTISNTGTGNLTLAGIAITGTNAGDFAQTDNCSVVLAPQASCIVSVTFTPGAATSRTAALTITHNGSGSPKSIPLSGTGTTAPPPPPWPNGYSYLAMFTVAAGKVPSTQSGFPVLISGTFADFRTVANGGRVANTATQTTGTSALSVPTDLIFTSDAGGTALLSWEFESYSAATGAATVWVKAPTLSSGSVIYAWYGNSAVTTLQTTPSGAWGSDFLAVYHLREATTGAAPQLADSTAGAHHGTLSGTLASSQQQPGQIAGSMDFSAAQAWGALAKPADFGFERTDAFSVAGWFKTNSNTSGTLLSKLDASSTTGWGLFQFATASTPRFALGLLGNGATGNYAMVATNAITSGSWHYVVATYAGTSAASGLKIYVDGVSQPLTTISDTLTASILNTQTAVLNGRGGATNMSSDGIDEVRVSAKGIVLSPDWITTSYNNQSNPAGFFTVSTGLTSSGGGSAPIVSLSTASLSFANQTTNTTSAAQSIGLTNNGPGALTISSINITGTNSSDFAGTTTCPIAPATLAAGGSCAINVTFTPTATGTRTAAVTITDNGVGSPRSVSLSGTGVAPTPTVGLSPASLTFASQTTNTTSAAQSITVTNNGPGTLTISSVNVTGANAADFARTTTCPLSPSTLGVGSTCTISVTFTPSAPGTRTAAVSITDNGSGSPLSVGLTGTGTAPPPPPPWPNGYTYKATFTVAAGKAPSAQANFPVVISGTFADFRTVPNGGRIVNTTTQSVGSSALTVPSDLIFTSDAAGTSLLNWEFESYSSATGAVAVWVKVPSVISGTTIYAWYGKASVTTLQTVPTTAWGTDYLAVYHLKENTTNPAPQLIDSTAGAHDGSLSGTTTSGQQQPGQIGGSMDFSAAQAWAALANPADFNFERTDSFSIAGWFKTSSDTSGTLLSKVDATSTKGWALYQFATATTPRFAIGLHGDGSANNYAMVATNPFSTGAWHYVVVTYAGTSSVAGMKIYVDGVSQPLTTISDTLTVSTLNTQTPALNGRGGPTNMSSDGIDEVRVSAKGVVLSSDWVTTSYNNQSSPSTFFVVSIGLTSP